MKIPHAIVIILLAALAIWPQPIMAQFPGSGQVPLDQSAVPKFVDPLPHFAYPGMRVDATRLGTPLTVEVMSLNQQALSTGTLLPDGVTVSATTGLTHVWGYRISNGIVTRGPHWPGFTVEARRGIPLDVLYLNKLNESYDAVHITVDQTIHWAMMMDMGGPMNMDPYTGPVPIVAHLHGGEVPSWSDGGPNAWYTPDGATAGPSASTNLYHYPNTQEGTTLWFHDHALGATRTNVYAGLAAFYFLRDANEPSLRLPGWTGDGRVQEKDPVTGANHGAAYPPEIELGLQDRMFDQHGQLFFPAGGDNPMIHPWWLPEFFGNIMTVNGKTWPYLSVAPRKYRFRILEGSNARFYNLALVDAATGAPGPAIQVIGTDGGFLDTPAVIDPALGQRLLTAPGERYDIVVDFGSIPNPNPAVPQEWILVNNAAAPYPAGDIPLDTETGVIMKFIVNGVMVGPDRSVVTGRRLPSEKLADFTTGLPVVTVNKWRQLTLNEVEGENGPISPLVNNTNWSGTSTRPYQDFTTDPSGLTTDLYSELPTEGETEVWQIINLTMDAHPIHLHLVQFQLLTRQDFDAMAYDTIYNAAFVAAGQPGGFVGAFGPPLDYDTGRDTSGTQWTTYLGGNPDVTPYLMGAPTTALPNERGWKDTFIMYPGQVTTVIVRWAPQDTRGMVNKYFSFDPSIGPGYVWHCHIVDHEDNEMMRPDHVYASPTAPRHRLGGPTYLGYLGSHPGLPLLTLSVEQSTPDAPTAFALEQNYPNPFNPATTIRFALPVDSHVKLVVYNAAGQKVSTLIDADAPAGNHTVELNASKLTSGVYFYRLSAGNFTETKKMILLR